jgi:hypothetical protein
MVHFSYVIIGGHKVKISGNVAPDYGSRSRIDKMRVNLDAGGRGRD